MLYPMIFEPRFVQKMWGGRRLESVLGKPLPADEPVGESWELYDFPPGVLDRTPQWHSPKLTNGPLVGKTLHDLVVEFGTDFYGDVGLVGSAGQFPVLIKFLDARDDLSVQVHPTQQYAKEHSAAHLKNEAWYVIAADPAARILKGLRPGTTRAAFEKSIADGTCEELLNTILVKPDQCFYLPSGTVHALGAGCLVAEVQTPSDTTFRVFDFERVDPATGQKRELHVAEALDCIEFGVAEEPQPSRQHTASFFTAVTRLVTAPQFMIEKVRMSDGVEQPIPYEQPVVWIMLAGRAQLSSGGMTEPLSVERGTTVLLPAKMDNPVVAADGDASWLEVTFPTG